MLVTQPKKSFLREVNMGKERFVLLGHFPQFTPELLFSYWVRADFISQWWAEHAEITARPGGTYLYAWPRHRWRARGAITDFDYGKLLSFTWAWDHEIGYPTRKVAVMFKPSDRGGASLSLMQGVYGLKPLEQRLRANHLDCWKYFLERLHALDIAQLNAGDTIRLLDSSEYGSSKKP